MTRTVTVQDLIDAEAFTSSAGTVLVISGRTPTGKELKIRIRACDWHVGQIGEQLHVALKQRELELRRVREKLEGKA